MHGPRVSDDGSKVTLDLHGATFDDAIDITVATLKLASERGRSVVKVIHGSSTSSLLYSNRTIKNELHSMLDAGLFDRFVTSSWKADDYLLLSLRLSKKNDPRPITLAEVIR
jgi:hypothetical protein